MGAQRGAARTQGRHRAGADGRCVRAARGVARGPRRPNVRGPRAPTVASGDPGTGRSKQSMCRSAACAPGAGPRDPRGPREGTLLGYSLFACLGVRRYRRALPFGVHVADLSGSWSRTCQTSSVFDDPVTMATLGSCQCGPGR